MDAAVVDAHALEIATRGYTILRDAYAPEQVARLRETLVEEYEAAGRPPVTNPGHLVDQQSYSTPTAAGFAVSRILTSRPDVAPLLLVEDSVNVVRRALGDDMRLEIAGGVLSDRTRAFFKWHNHVGGVDELQFKDRPPAPAKSPQRILMLVYLDAVNDESGSLLIYPRRIDDPLAAPHAIEQLHWEGEVVVDVAPGTAVLLEQSTWHAALPQKRDGLRTFVGFYFAAATAPKPQAIDESLATFRTDVPLLASVLPGAAR